MYYLSRWIIREEIMSKRKRTKEHRKRADARMEVPWPAEFTDDPSVVIVNTPPEMEKMSDMLKMVAAPWLVTAMTETVVQEIMTAAAVAWNLSLLPQSERKEALRHAPVTINNEDKELFNQLIHRKQQLYPDCRRWVQSVQ